MLVLSVLLLGLGVSAGWAYVRNQYYVGVDGQQVAVFRGVNGTVAGVPLSSVDERTPLAMDRLDDDALARVEKGIVAKDRQEAVEIVQRLEERAEPECVPAPTPTASPTPVSPLATPTPTLPPAPLPPGVPSLSPTPLPTFVPAPTPSPTPSLQLCAAIS